MSLISVTGASGTLGALSVESLLKDPENRLRVLLRGSKRGKKAARRYVRRFGSRVEIVYGDVRKYEDCLRLLEGADYLLHLAAVIPPAADHNAKLTLAVNIDGTKNLICAALESGNRVRFIFISSVAVYGGRDEKHPWGRVGDPLVTSAFDVYGQTKMISEFALMESGLKNWAVLRISAVLYDNLLTNNISDGLMFHTPWNAPIEWITAADSASLST
ncbi:MAG: NAD-dependent epimerase/dehydratase family protein, partial [Lachnospiraceae bacterium]|nr:NAD-dependent epimerase/dehydratase family protein [Lachnospiraceae bacterium]